MSLMNIYIMYDLWCKIANNVIRMKHTQNQKISPILISQNEHITRKNMNRSLLHMIYLCIGESG